MTLTRIITRTATIALAAAALAAPTASARPADMPPALAKATAAPQHEESRRTPDAIDPTPHKEARHPYATSGYRTQPAHVEQANPRPDASLQAADRGSAWTTIGLGTAAGLLALAAVAGIVLDKRRAGRPRTPA